jgi:regulator of replication initiation timing
MKYPLWIVKIFNYEYWSWWVFYLPMAPYWIYQAIRTRSFTYFTAVNPGIEAGGFYGEKKMEILKNIRPDLLPKTTFINKELDFNKVHNSLIISELQFPIIAKPNIGERGNSVAKLLNLEDLKIYHNTTKEDYIIQEFITFDIELGVLFSRMPDESKGKVSSVTIKEFLTVNGDGKSTIEELVLNNTRARFQYETLKERLGEDIKEVLKNGEKRLLEPIGNHCRGTKFVNANHLINSQLDTIFTEASKNFDGFFYGRFDMKVKSIEDLYEGKNIRIMELNGVSSDPGHIYDPNYHLWQAYRDLKWHWKRVADISIQNQKRGFKPLPFSEVWGIVKTHFKV